MDFDACQQSFTSNPTSPNEGFQSRLYRVWIVSLRAVLVGQAERYASDVQRSH